MQSKTVYLRGGDGHGKKLKKLRQGVGSGVGWRQTDTEREGATDTERN